MAKQHLFQVFRGPGIKKPALSIGEFYLDTTNDVLFMQGKNTELRFALASDLSGYLSKTGGTVTGNVIFGVDEEDNVDVTIHGNLHLGTSSSETRQLVFGDGANAYIAEPDDDYLTIHASNDITIDGNCVNFANMSSDSSNPLPVNQGGTGKTTALTAADVGALPSGGTAVAASKLATAGTIQINLGSTSATTYTNGGNITPGVSGTLPVARGGTGITNAQPMRKSGTLSLTTTWSGSAGNYTQYVTVTGITAAAVPIVIPQITTTAQQTAWNLLTPKVNANAGSITFYSTTKTTTAVPFIVLWAV